MDPTTVSTVAALPQDLLRQSELTLAPLPPPAPDLVSRFESLMSRAPVTTSESMAESSMVKSAVSAAEGRLQHYADTVERLTSVETGTMSMAELQALQMQSQVKLGLLSMEQAAYMQTLGSTKSTVSALLKNQ